MCINDNYIVVCDIMDEIYVIPENFDKKDFSGIEKLSSRGFVSLLQPPKISKRTANKKIIKMRFILSLHNFLCKNFVFAVQ